MKIVLWDIDQKSIDSVAKDIQEQKGQAFVYCCDVSKKEEVYATAKKVQMEVGHVDILVNNAGIVTGQKLLNSSDENISRLMDVNVMAHFWVSCSFFNTVLSYDFLYHYQSPPSALLSPSSLPPSPSQ